MPAVPHFDAKEIISVLILVHKVPGREHQITVNAKCSYEINGANEVILLKKYGPKDAV